MKLLDKTIFKKKNAEIRFLRSTNEALFNKNKALITKVNELENLLTEEIKTKKKYSGRCGGLTKQIHKLEKQNDELKAELFALQVEFDKFKENKFIVKELKPTKAPRRSQVMSIKNGQKTSNIIAKVKNSAEAE